MESFLKNILRQDYSSDSKSLGVLPLQSGAYHIYLKSDNESNHLEGILRIEHILTDNSGDEKFIVSGDLYEMSSQNNGDSTGIDINRLIDQTSRNQVPYFQKERYRYYIGLKESPVMDRHSLTIPITIQKYSHSLDQKRWTELNGQLVIESFDSETSHLKGYLQETSSGTPPSIIGTIEAVKVSDYFRKATVKIDTVSGVSAPPETDEVSWQYAFRQTKWLIETVVTDGLVHSEGSDEWGAADLHGALKGREGLENGSWLYHLLCIKYFNDYTPGDPKKSAGWMFDTESIPNSPLPREGAAISGHWEFPEGNQWCDNCSGRIESLNLAYLRLAIHEILHAMGILHDESNANLTNFTKRVAGHYENTFPTKDCFFLNPPAILQLNHFPDPFIRPGMIKYDRISSFADAPQPETISSLSSTVSVPSGLEFFVNPYRATLPLGAPARFDLTLKNTKNSPINVPISIGLNHSFLQIRVTNEQGEENHVRSIFRLTDFDPTRDLDPNDKVEGSVTILGGSSGPLFPKPGLYKLTFTISWLSHNKAWKIECEESVRIDQEDKTSKLSDRINQDSETTLALILGHKYRFENEQIIEEAIKDAILGGHFHYLWIRNFIEKNSPDNNNVKRLSDEILKKKTILNKQEASKLLQWLELAPNKTDDLEKLKSHFSYTVNH